MWGIQLVSPIFIIQMLCFLLKGTIKIAQVSQTQTFMNTVAFLMK